MTRCSPCQPCGCGFLVQQIKHKTAFLILKLILYHSSFTETDLGSGHLSPKTLVYTVTVMVSLLYNVTMWVRRLYKSNARDLTPLHVRDSWALCSFMLIRDRCLFNRFTQQTAPAVTMSLDSCATVLYGSINRITHAVSLYNDH